MGKLDMDTSPPPYDTSIGIYPRQPGSTPVDTSIPMDRMPMDGSKEDLKPPPTEPTIFCLSVTTIWSLVGLVLFIPGLAMVTIHILTTFTKILYVLKTHEPETEKEMEFGLKPVEIIVEIIKGVVLMLHGSCVLSGLHGQDPIRKRLYLTISVYLFLFYSLVCWGFAVTVVYFKIVGHEKFDSFGVLTLILAFLFFSLLTFSTVKLWFYKNFVRNY